MPLSQYENEMESDFTFIILLPQISGNYQIFFPPTFYASNYNSAFQLFLIPFFIPICSNTFSLVLIILLLAARKKVNGGVKVVCTPSVRLYKLICHEF